VQLILPLKPQQISFISDENWLIEGNRNSGHISDLLLKRLNEVKQDNKAVLTARHFPGFLQVERRLHFAQQWELETIVTRLTPMDTVVRVAIPLLEGEQVLGEALTVKNNNMQVQLQQNQQHFSWRSLLNQTDTINLKAQQTDQWIEHWNLSWQPIWHIEWQGLPLISNGKIGSVSWQPWPGEQLDLQVQRPISEQGQTLTLDGSVLHVKPGQRSSDIELSLSLRSSLGQQHTINMPAGAILSDVTINGRDIPLQIVDDSLILPINPGKQLAEIKWRQTAELTTMMYTPKLGLGLTGVNHEIELFMPSDRWLLAVGGPNLGPAVLMWGVLFILFILAFVLARLQFTPLKSQDWILLLLGLTQASMLMLMLIIVVGWIIALGIRDKRDWAENRIGFNISQVALGVLTIAALTSLLFAIEQGLLGQPEMQILGNGSHNNYLHWYQDHNDKILPQAWVISLPLYVYRILMMLWSLWLAFALLSWLKWGWQCFSRDGIWRHINLDMSANKLSSFKNNTNDKNKS
jgi:hypothetical protein